MLLLLAYLAALDPIDASHLVQRWTQTDVDLVAIARRESAGQRIGVHAGDAWTSVRSRRQALRVGWLRPWCPFVWTTEGWGTRGGFGLNAAYSVHLLGACVPPQALDVPIVSALVAVWRAEHPRCERHLACRRWRST